MQKLSTGWNDIFPATDLSERLQTRQLLDAWRRERRYSREELKNE